MHALRAVVKIIPAVVFTVILSVHSPVSTAADAQQSVESGCRWQSAFPDHLGIDPGQEIADGQLVQMVRAVVTDPDRLSSMGLFGVRQGDRIRMRCIDADVWRIKHYATGLTITFSSRPF
jgi:hypothetical protein